MENEDLSQRIFAGNASEQVFARMRKKINILDFFIENVSYDGCYREFKMYGRWEDKLYKKTWNPADTAIK